MTRQVFVVGAGRCGTRSVSDLLSGVPGCRVVHERQPQLLDEVTAFLEGGRSSEAMVELLRTTRAPFADGERLSGEANQRLSYVLPALVDAFPDLRLVWLIRDGRDAVTSMHHRLWYDPHEAERRPGAVRAWAANRIRGDVVGDVSAEEWDRLDPFGRCCWYWSHTNRLIEREIQRLAVPALRVRIECLRETLPALWSFLDLAGPVPGHIPRANRASGGRPLSWHFWSRGQCETFHARCASVMDRHYAGWREEMPAYTARREVLARVARGLWRFRSFSVSTTRPLRTRVGLARSR